MSEELKPCPFCASKPEAIGLNNNGSPFIVVCENCGLEFGLEKEYKFYQIVEAWNRRIDNAKK